MTTKRSLQMMDNSKNICVVNKIKTTTRLNKYIFSRPINLFLGRRLYQHRSFAVLPDHETIGSGVFLPELFPENPTAKVIISGQISYGDALDKQISALSEDNKIIRQSSEHDTGVISMFARGRAEFALLYPHQVYDSSLTLNARSYAIAAIPPYVVGQLMCTKNIITERFIKRINAHLSSQNSLDKLLNIHFSHINPNDKEVVEYYFRQAFYN